jgi:hypothetical protein
MPAGGAGGRGNASFAGLPGFERNGTNFAAPGSVSGWHRKRINHIDNGSR